MMSIFVFEEKRKQLNEKEYAPFFSVKKSQQQSTMNCATAD
jgi:hypothetical protein